MCFSSSRDSLRALCFSRGAFPFDCYSYSSYSNVSRVCNRDHGQDVALSFLLYVSVETFLLVVICESGSKLVARIFPRFVREGGKVMVERLKREKEGRREGRIEKKSQLHGRRILGKVGGHVYASALARRASGLG